MSRRISFIMLCTLFILFAGRVPSVRGEGWNQTAGNPEIVKVGIYLLRAGSLDISTGAIDVDFYIDFTCEKDCDKNQDKFEIVNGTLRSAVLLEDADSAHNPTYRATATVFQDVDLRQYPFDKHQVKIVIESSIYDQSQVAYVVNEKTTAIDPQVFILGWEMERAPTAKIVEQYYQAWDLYYTRYEFTTELSKPPLAGWLKGLLPAIFIALGSLFALFITSKNIGNRVAIITSALVASVLYHLNFTSRVPSIGYLTYADTFMMINYIIILISLVLTIWIIRSDGTDSQALVARVNKIEIIAIPGLWIVLHVLNALWIL